MNRKLLLILVAIMFSGCGTLKPKPMGSETMKLVRNADIVSVVKEPSAFYGSTRFNDVFGVLGGISAIFYGDSLVEKYNIRDPSEGLADFLSSTLEDEYGSNTIENVYYSINYNDSLVESWNELYGDALLLEVTTKGWGIARAAYPYDGYKVYYSVNVRLIDMNRNTSIAEGSCAWNPKEIRGTPTFGELIYGDAYLIKSELSFSTDYCGKEIAGRVFGVNKS